MFPKLTEEAFCGSLEIHLMGSLPARRRCCRSCQRMAPAGSSTSTSAAGLTGTIGQANYGAAKAGIIGLTKSLARELARRKITVNALAPLAADADDGEHPRQRPSSPRKTLERIPLGRLGQARGDRGQLRVPGLRRGRVTSPARSFRRRRDGDLMARRDEPVSPGARC